MEAVVELQRTAEIGRVCSGNFLERDAVEIAAETLFEVIALLLFAALGKGNAWPLGGIAEALLDDGDLKRAVGIELRVDGVVNAIGGGLHDGQRDELAPAALA